jgi:hypothetical protein
MYRKVWRFKSSLAHNKIAVLGDGYFLWDEKKAIKKWLS